MTEVIDPTTASTPLQSLTDVVRAGSDITNDVALLKRSPGDVAPRAANDDAARLSAIAVNKEVQYSVANRERIGVRFLSRIRAWMLVPLVDFGLIVAPLAWRPPQIHAVVAMAVLGTLLLTGGGRYRARLHLSVLDELPTIVTRLLTAAAAVSAGGTLTP